MVNRDKAAQFGSNTIVGEDSNGNPYIEELTNGNRATLKPDGTVEATNGTVKSNSGGTGGNGGIEIGNNGAEIYLNSSGEIVAVDEAGNETVLS